MSHKTLSEIANEMRNIDFAMLMTHSPDGQIGGRPMSNNREVEYQGDSYYFTWEDSQMVKDIERDRKVAIAFQGGRHLLGKPGIHINVEGEAQVVRDPAAFREHWNRELEHWFEQGVQTPGLVMIRVHARRVNYWDGRDEGQIEVQ